MEQPEEGPKIVKEVAFDKWCVRREENRIWFIESDRRGAGLLKSKIAIVLTDEGGLWLEPKWEEHRRLDMQWQRKWQAIIRRLCLPHHLEFKLSALTYPPSKSRPIGIIPCLWKIAHGKIKVQLDDEEREILADVLNWAYSTDRL